MITAAVPSQATVAIVGAGISGLSLAWLLRDRYRVTLYEKADSLGGHSNTVDIELGGVRHAVDTGFLVHNDLTYPHFVAMLRHLGVATDETDMSFSVSVEQPDLEWAGADLSTVFAQRRNLLRPAFLGMLRDILRFNRNARRYLDEVEDGCTLHELLDRERYGLAMRQWYLLPMAAAIWSSSVRDILGFPARTFLTFCLNHCLLRVSGRPKWKTIQGGSRTYVNRLASPLEDVRLSANVTRVWRDAEGAWVACGSLPAQRFDAVVFAAHAPDVLGMLDADPQEREILGAIRYQSNRAVLHTDVALLPRRRKTWSAWNYMAVATRNQTSPVAVSYSINRLQHLPLDREVIVTLNPLHKPATEHILRSFDYAHPVMDTRAIDAQTQLATIQGHKRTWFAGAWTRYGFHEDGLLSAINVAREFGVEPPWSTSI